MSDTPAPSTPPAVSADEDNTIAIISYLFGIGFVIAAVMFSSKKTPLSAFHLRQSLGLIIVGIAGWFVFIALGIMAAVLAGIPVVGFVLIKSISLLNMAYGLGMLVLWIMGILGAANREQKPLPVLGALFQQKLATLFT
ncbi:MAG: hypothetical protein IPL39_13960 [Opitutaceae bacterium]|nr:hypothetical protein [Opitutaceae bacterium]